jgi:hypothetical protein
MNWKSGQHGLKAGLLINVQFILSTSGIWWKQIDAARAIWHKRFDCQLPGIMTTDQCNEALKIGFEILQR